MTDRTNWRELRRAIARALDDDAGVAGASDLPQLLAALSRAHAMAVAAADEALELVELSAAAAAAHLGAAHRAADSARDVAEPLRAHVYEAFAVEAGRPRVEALELRASWLAALLLVVDRLRLDALPRVVELIARRPVDALTTSPRVSQALVADLEVARLGDELPPVPGAPAASRRSWLHVPALTHRLGPGVEVALPAFWIARRPEPATTWSAARDEATALGAELPTELAWEAAARLLGPCLVAGPRWEWCADAHDRRLLLRAGVAGPHAGRGDPRWRTARTLEALDRRRRLAAEATVPDAAVRPLRRATGGPA